jgi:hypothetical protein
MNKVQDTAVQSNPDAKSINMIGVVDGKYTLNIQEIKNALASVNALKIKRGSAPNNPHSTGGSNDQNDAKSSAEGHTIDLIHNALYSLLSKPHDENGNVNVDQDFFDKTKSFSQVGSEKMYHGKLKADGTRYGLGIYQHIQNITDEVQRAIKADPTASKKIPLQSHAIFTLKKFSDSMLKIHDMSNANIGQASYSVSEIQNITKGSGKATYIPQLDVTGRIAKSKIYESETIVREVENIKRMLIDYLNALEGNPEKNSIDIATTKNYLDVVDGILATQKHDITELKQYTETDNRRTIVDGTKYVLVYTRKTNDYHFEPAGKDETISDADLFGGNEYHHVDENDFEETHNAKPRKNGYNNNQPNEDDGPSWSTPEDRAPVVDPETWDSQEPSTKPTEPTKPTNTKPINPKDSTNEQEPETKDGTPRKTTETTETPEGPETPEVNEQAAGKTPVTITSPQEVNDSEEPLSEDIKKEIDGMQTNQERAVSLVEAIAKEAGVESFEYDKSLSLTANTKRLREIITEKINNIKDAKKGINSTLEDIKNTLDLIDKIGGLIESEVNGLSEYKKHLTINGNKELRSVHNAIKKHGNDANYPGYKQSNKNKDGKSEPTNEDDKNHNYAKEPNPTEGGSKKTKDSNPDDEKVDDSSTVDVDDDSLKDIFDEGFMSKEDIDELQPEDFVNIFDKPSSDDSDKTVGTIDEIRAYGKAINEKVEAFLGIISGRDEAATALVDNINRNGLELSGDKQRAIFYKFKKIINDRNTDILRGCK